MLFKEIKNKNYITRNQKLILKYTLHVELSIYVSNRKNRGCATAVPNIMFLEGIASQNFKKCRP